MQSLFADAERPRSLVAAGGNLAGLGETQWPFQRVHQNGSFPSGHSDSPPGFPAAIAKLERKSGTRGRR
jgi:hypothetical protein